MKERIEEFKSVSMAKLYDQKKAQLERLEREVELLQEPTVMLDHNLIAIEGAPKSETSLLCMEQSSFKTQVTPVNHRLEHIQPKLNIRMVQRQGAENLNFLLIHQAHYVDMGYLIQCHVDSTLEYQRRRPLLHA